MRAFVSCGKAVLSVSVILGLLVGCASNPNKIQASYVSPLQYSHLDCDQIRMEMVRVSARVSEVSGAQKKQANGDAVAMGVGLVIFWPALFFLAGGDRKEELARLKGEYEALQSAAIEKKCSYAEEMQAAAAEAEAKAKEEDKEKGKAGDAYKGL